MGVCYDGPMTIRFGRFEFSRRDRRLTRDGEPVKLTGQPLELLMLLTEDPGTLVTRDQIRARLWPATTVGFDHGLHVVVNRLRATLGESAKAPVFIEAVPRIGYRLNVPQDRPTQIGKQVRASRGGIVYAMAGLIAFLTVLLAMVHRHYGELLAHLPHSVR